MKTERYRFQSGNHPTREIEYPKTPRIPPNKISLDLDLAKIQNESIFLCANSNEDGCMGRVFSDRVDGFPTGAHSFLHLISSELSSFLQRVYQRLSIPFLEVPQSAHPSTTLVPNKAEILGVWGTNAPLLRLIDRSRGTSRSNGYTRRTSRRLCPHNLLDKQPLFFVLARRADQFAQLRINLPSTCFVGVSPYNLSKNTI